MERRYLQRDTEMTATENGIVGYAAVYNSLSEPIGGVFREEIATGAFALALQRNPDVRCLVNHEPTMILGRTKSGTLQLMNTSKGLRFSVETLPACSYANDLREALRRGDVDQSSFAFEVPPGTDTWREEVIDGQRVLIRTIHDVSLYDVSPVTFPAYTSTEVGLRSAQDSLKRWFTKHRHSIDRAWLELWEL